MTNVNLLDCTLRDGGYVINFQFSSRDTRLITRSLDKAGIRFIEVGHGLGLSASSGEHGVALEPDENYITAARESVDEAHIGCFFIPGIGSIEDIYRAANAGLDFIRIGYNVNEISVCQEYVEAAAKANLKVFLNLMKTYAVPVKEFPDAVRLCHDWPLEAIYVVDSAGGMMATEVADYVKAIGEATGQSVGFHGHNNLGLANGNTLTAVAAGATYVDASLGGMGRSAGNAQTEIIAALLEKNGWSENIDIYELLNAADNWVRPLITHPQGLTPLDIVIGLSRFHSGHLPRFKRVLNKFDVDLFRLISEVSKIDCIDPNESLIEEVARDINRVADN